MCDINIIKNMIKRFIEINGFDKNISQVDRVIIITFLKITTTSQ